MVRLFPGGAKSAGAFPPGAAARWEDRVPGRVAEGWRAFGEFATTDGFVRAVNPTRLVPWIPMADTLPDAFPLFTTAWGDVLALHGTDVRLISHRLGLHFPFPAGPDELLDVLEAPEFQRDLLLRGDYDDAVAAHGEPHAGECLAHPLPLARGGSPTPANTAVRSLTHHLDFLARFHGTPRHLTTPTTGFASPGLAARVARGRYLLEMTRPGDDYRYTELPDGVEVRQARSGPRIIVGDDTSVLLAESSAGDIRAAWRDGRRTTVAELARATYRPDGSPERPRPADTDPPAALAGRVARVLAPHTGFTATGADGHILAALGDRETRWEIRAAAGGYKLWESQHGHRTLRSQARYLPDLLRHLAVDRLGGGESRPAGHGLGARMLFTDHGDGIEARWTEAGEEHRLRVFGAYTALEYLPRCPNAPLDLKAVIRSLAAPDNLPLFAPTPT